MQVRAVAALYGVEARACGRKGLTLFKTSKSAPLTTDGAAQVQQLHLSFYCMQDDVYLITTINRSANREAGF